jgi:hypothetical protein
MKSQLTFAPEVLICCALDIHRDYYYLTLLVTYEHFNILAMFCNPIEMFWDELDRRVKEKQPTSVQHIWELLLEKHSS